ncbi:MAG: hypothetical protein HS103_01515 [Anaerolineales bacterium]|nr:hypothetical protein [Anaerolineales bacterium]
MTDPVYTCRQYRLLITGSRHATPEMLDMARRAVTRAKSNGWMVLVGDNPQGVDAAVIDACDALGVNVLVCGTAPQPRKGSQREGSYWQVDVKRRDDDATLFDAYAARDRWMIDLCDRMLAIWNGQSRGTKAGFDYARQIGKTANLVTFEPPQTASTRLPVPRTLHTVELIIDAGDRPNDLTFEGVYGLRALDEMGDLLYDATASSPADVHTSDAARMQMLIMALERLTARLQTDQAPYCLRVFQSSKNVEGWCAKSWRRNVPEVQRLTARIETLLQRFPNVEWVKMPRAQVASKLSKIEKGGAARR